MAPCEGSFVVGTSLSTTIGVADGVDGVADGVDDVTFAASHVAFSTLVSFCPGSHRFPVSPSYNFLGATWNSSEMVEVLSLLLNKCLRRTVWITATRQRVGCLGGRTANAGWNGLGKHWFIVRSNLTIHHLDTPFIIWQPIHRPRLLERVYKPICTPHWCRDLRSLLLRALEIGCK